MPSANQLMLLVNYQLLTINCWLNQPSTISREPNQLLCLKICEQELLQVTMPSQNPITKNKGKSTQVKQKNGRNNIETAFFLACNDLNRASPNCHVDAFVLDFLYICNDGYSNTWISADDQFKFGRAFWYLLINLAEQHIVTSPLSKIKNNRNIELFPLGSVEISQAVLYPDDSHTQKYRVA